MEKSVTHATMHPMILTLEIEKVVSGIYRAHAFGASVEVSKPEEYPTIADAICGEAQAVPDGFAHFMEVRYAGFSSGTDVIQNLPARAEEIADRLVALVAEAHRLS